MVEMYENKNTLEKTFDYDFLSGDLQQAQRAEFIELKKIIKELSDKNGHPISILDIGIGNARIPKLLFEIKEIWNNVEKYDGIDNSKNCIQIAKKVINDLKLQDKVSIKYLDAVNLDNLDQKYDLIILTWFTAGNFYPDKFPFENYSKKIYLKENKKFDTIFKNAYNLLKFGGEIVIGSCYIDNESTRKKQENFYKKCGMKIITDNKESFTATKEGFWSQRFTKDKIRNYLNWISPKKISFFNLDTYNYAMLVRIKK
ncbi:MAG: class I SAM-dependent methyltransferase [archaeon]|nr:class I SAM-dependent methyltransferase [archaeon]